MKKGYKIGILVFIILIGIGGIFFAYQAGYFFNPGDRYDWQELDYMGVPYENASDINAWNEGYSESDDCPWGFEHNGLDFFFNDSAKVLAMTPGQVIDITFKDTGDDSNRYHIAIEVRFNREITVRYNFEPWTDNEEKAQKQSDEFEVKPGDWIGIGDHIADFVAYDESAHIHYDFNVNGEQTCPKDYFSDNAYDEIMDLIHSYHPDWNMCYD